MKRPSVLLDYAHYFAIHLGQAGVDLALQRRFFFSAVESVSDGSIFSRTLITPASIAPESLVVGIRCRHLEFLIRRIKNSLLRVVGAIGKAGHLYL